MTLEWFDLPAPFERLQLRLGAHQPRLGGLDECYDLAHEHFHQAH
jgi:hypothetical protein